jgi:hypothetical protein
MIAEDQKIEREADLLEKHLREAVKDNDDLDLIKSIHSYKFDKIA